MSRLFGDFRDELNQMSRSIESIEEERVPEGGTPGVDDKGKDPDSGPEVEKTENVENVPEVDEVFKDYVTDPEPASAEELEIENQDGSTEINVDEVEQLTVEAPGAIDADDVCIDEAEDSENPVEVTDENANVSSTDSEPVEEQPKVEPTEENPNGELGINIDQAIECLIRGREEEIQVIVGDTEVSIDEAGKVSVDQNGDGGAASSEEPTSSEETPEEPSNEEPSNEPPAEEKPAEEPAPEGDTSAESINLYEIFTKGSII